MNKFKSNIKKSKILAGFYWLSLGVICLFSPVLAIKIRYRISTGKVLDLNNPNGFNEKLIWLNLYDKDPLKAQCADKLLVREYVKDKDCKNILNDLYDVYDKVEEINWKVLPDQFVLKSTYMAGANVICNDKSKLNIDNAKLILEKGLKTSILNPTAEMHYSKETNKIICERYIETTQGLLPNDFKIYCFNGEPKAILAMEDRDSEVSKMFYDLDWNPLDKYSNKNTCKSNIKKPNNLDLLIYYARKLSKDFPFVRVDLYDTGEKVIFGELTFTPAGCISGAHSQAGNEYFGELLKLPK